MEDKMLGSDLLVEISRYLEFPDIQSLSSISDLPGFLWIIILNRDFNIVAQDEVNARNIYLSRFTTGYNIFMKYKSMYPNIRVDPGDQDIISNIINETIRYNRSTLFEFPVQIGYESNVSILIVKVNQGLLYQKKISGPLGWDFIDGITIIDTNILNTLSSYLDVYNVEILLSRNRISLPSPHVSIFKDINGTLENVLVYNGEEFIVGNVENGADIKLPIDLRKFSGEININLSEKISDYFNVEFI